MMATQKGAAPQTPKRESDYQTAIIKYLRSIPAAFAWKAAAGPYSYGGIPDVCAVIDGRFYGFEVKRPGGKPTELQKQAISKINAAGGTAAVVTFVSEVKEIVERTEPRV